MSTIPPALAESTDASDHDARMTAARDEIKYVVAHEALSRLALELGRKLPHHRFAGEGANRLPGAQHYVTTVYFDTEARDQYRADRLPNRSQHPTARAPGGCRLRDEGRHQQRGGPGWRILRPRGES